jgi:hypothetical protein
MEVVIMYLTERQEKMLLVTLGLMILTTFGMLMAIDGYQKENAVLQTKVEMYEKLYGSVETVPAYKNK